MRARPAAPRAPRGTPLLGERVPARPGPWGVGAAVAAVYALLALAIAWAATFSASGQVAASFWPAAGVSVAALLVLPRRLWPAVLGGVFAAEVLVDLGNGIAPGTALVWGTVNVVEPLISVLLLRRDPRCGPDLARRPDLVRFLLCAVVAGPAVGGALSTLALTGGDTRDLALHGLKWALGDAVGVLAVAPALLALRRSARTGRPFPTGSVLLVGALAVATCWATALLEDTGAPVHSLVCLLLPALVRLALSGGQRASATGVLLVALVLEGATAAGTGPFASADSGDAMVDTQVFLAACALTASLVAVATHDLVRRDAIADGLREQACTDPLTGLGNRRQVFEGTEQGFTACLVVDLDGFKQVNDTYGHPAGDALLVEVAARLRQVTRTEDVVARTGGDEFVLCFTRVLSEADLEQLRRRVEADVARPYAWGGRTVRVTASTGTGWSGGAAVPVEDLVRQADAAMYAAKRSLAARRGPALAAES